MNVPVDATDELDTLAAAQVGNARCDGCPHRQATRCELRALELELPSERICANHPELGTSHASRPVGPVFGVDASGLWIAAEWRPTRVDREHLIDALAEIRVSTTDELAFRERVLIRETRRLGDRAAFVHLDRLEGLLSRPAVASSSVLSLLHEAAQRQGITDERGRVDPTRVSLPGRLLVVSSFVVFGVCYWAEVELQIALLDRFGRTRLSIWPVFSLLTAVGYLGLGLLLFRRLGVAFRADDTA